MGWKEKRRRIQTLMVELEKAYEHDKEHGTDKYTPANKKLDQAVREQPWWRQANGLYR
jgi:ElaB/YqjD/DUF883 family membrane-anchored ribosome-binding protein